MPVTEFERPNAAARAVVGAGARSSRDVTGWQWLIGSVSGRTSESAHEV